MRRAAGALGVIALISVACTSTPGATTAPNASPGSSGAATGDPYKVGFTSDFSSQFGFIGLGLRTGATTFFDAQNARGGVGGHPVTMLPLDDGNDATKGIANATQLITQDQVSSMMGFQSSVVSAAVAPVVTQFETPMLTNTVSAALVDPVMPYLFAATVQTANYAAPQMQFAKKLMDDKGIAKPKIASITTSNSAALQQWQDSVKAMSDSLGWETVAAEVVAQGSIDMAPSIAKVEAANPDVLLLAIGQDPWIIAGMKTISDDGKDFPVISYDSPAWATVAEVASSRFYYVSALSYASETLTPSFYADASAAGVDPNAVYVIRGYYQGLIIADALGRCGFPCSGKAMRDALEATNLGTDGIIQGNVQYDPSSHEGVRQMAAFQWDTEKDQPVIVGTELKPGTTLSN